VPDRASAWNDQRDCVDDGCLVETGAAAVLNGSASGEAGGCVSEAGAIVQCWL
jgi:hypothetical protein